MANVGIAPAPWSQDNTRTVINLTVNAAYNVNTAAWTYLQTGTASRTELGPDGYFRSFTAGSGTAGGTIIWSAPAPASGDFVRRIGDTMTGSLTIEDSSGNVAGTLYLGNQSGGARSLNYDGTKYTLANANLNIGGHVIATHFDGTATNIDNQANSATITASTTPTANNIVQYDGAGQLYTNTTLLGYAGSRNGYGALSIWGGKGGWNGLNFADSGHANSGTLMVDPAGVMQGFYNNADTAWLWRFNNGVLDVGSVNQAANATNFANTAITGFNRGDATGSGATNRTFTWTSDANDVTRPSGFSQFQPSTPNAPTTDWFFLLQTNHTGNAAGNQYQWQLASPFFSDNMYYRRIQQSGPGLWYQIPLIRQTDNTCVNIANVRYNELLSNSYVIVNANNDYNGSAAWPSTGAIMFGAGPGGSGEGIASPRSGTDLGSVKIFANSSPWITVQSNGNVRLGSTTSAPSGLSGNVDISCWRSSTGGTTGVIALNLATNRFLYWDNTNYNMPGGNLILNGIQVNSSAEIKQNIRPFEPKHYKHYHNLKPSWFKYRDYGTSHESVDRDELRLAGIEPSEYIHQQSEQPDWLGFIAEDVEAIVPEAVQMSKEGPNGEAPVKGYNPVHLTAILWQRVQDAELRAEELAARLLAIEERLGAH